MNLLICLLDIRSVFVIVPLILLIIMKIVRLYKTDPYYKLFMFLKILDLVSTIYISLCCFHTILLVQYD